MPAIWICPAAGSGEEQYMTFFRYTFVGANHQAGFSPWRAIGWINTMTTGKRRQAANCVQSRLNYARWSSLLCWRKLTSPDQHAIYDWSWSGNSQANADAYHFSKHRFLGSSCCRYLKILRHHESLSQIFNILLPVSNDFSPKNIFRDPPKVPLYFSHCLLAS